MTGEVQVSTLTSSVSDWGGPGGVHSDVRGGCYSGLVDTTPDNEANCSYIDYYEVDVCRIV